MKLLMFAPYQS